jgi:hypothetical protein
VYNKLHVSACQQNSAQKTRQSAYGMHSKTLFKLNGAAFNHLIAGGIGIINQQHRLAT